MAINNIYSLSDKHIEDMLGHRFKSLRLHNNRSQQSLADATALSLNTIKALESGRGKLATIIAVLRELGELEQLDHCIPEITISPLQLARTQGKQRERASSKREPGPSDASGAKSSW